MMSNRPATAPMDATWLALSGERADVHELARIMVWVASERRARRVAAAIVAYCRRTGLVSGQLTEAVPARDDLDPQFNKDNRRWMVVSGPHTLMRDGSFRP